MKKITLITTLVVGALALSGCQSVAAVGERITDRTGSITKDICSKSEPERLRLQFLGFLALGGEGVPIIRCKGTPEFERAQKSATVALGIWHDLQAERYGSAFGQITQFAADAGVKIGSLKDADGCYASANGWRFCEPRPATE